ncbi:hypothetical protein [Hansschlegelia beijingensis]|uniref:Uncharacterized protein n=1 Tax=Hansschlegelia beijingensis TaxID=1133344 RepID=A0A7W6GEA9_9HYPH|nr:hypothetical protein [Hansschlegelia beijingensis]MBB3972005.1 hypothetical protein [Hansschlegelia beijingensis]
MRPSFNLLLSFSLCALVLAPEVRAEYRPGTIISEPADQRGGAITRPAGKPDREWRRGRKTPELRRAPQRPIAGPAAPPRFDSRGRRLDVPGRPDTYDAIGRVRRDYPRPGVTIVPSGPTVRTDAATRINQFPPR